LTAINPSGSHRVLLLFRKGEELVGEQGAIHRFLII